MRFFAALGLLFATATLFAQPKQNSPYSRFGIGDILPQTLANQAAWGGQTAAFHDPYHLNLVNPASYASLRTTAFETGLYAKYSHLTTTTDAKLDQWSGNLAYFALGFTLKSPINEVLDKNKSPWKYGMGISLTPYSQVGYNVETRSNQSGVDSIANIFQGTGGTYRFTWGSSAKYKNTSFGVNLGWLFGKASYEARTEFVDSSLTFQDLFRDDLGINGFLWNIGVQHDIILKHAENDKDVPTRWITLGATLESKHSIRVQADKYRARYRYTNGSQIIGTDTLLYQAGNRQKMTLPATFTFGIQYNRDAKWRVGAQFGIESWSQYTNEARPERLRNTFSVSGGLEYTPDFASYNHYGRRVRYRLGGYFRQDPRSINGIDLDDIGATFGFGFPITLPRQQTSFINTAFEIGKLGASSSIEETYFRVTLGFTLNDNTWFYKRRFE